MSKFFGKGCLIAAALALATTSCTHSVHQVHADGFESAAAKDGKAILAKSEQFVVFVFSGDTDYVDQAYRRLIDQCPSGRIVDVTTEWSTSHSFLSFYNKIHMRGRCISGS